MFVCWLFCFFFKQKTAYEMRISDWSSDVCSSDLLTIAPIVVPLLAGTMMVLIGESRRTVKAALGLVSAIILVVLAVALLKMADGEGAAVVRSYRLGDWPSLFGIVLVLDRLSALMLLLTNLLGFAALTFSLARWHRVGAHFHPLFQFQLMGLNGADRKSTRLNSSH